MSTTQVPDAVDLERARNADQLVNESYSTSDGAVIRDTSYQSRSTRSELPLPAFATGDPQADWWRSTLDNGLPQRPLADTVRTVDVFAGAGGLSLGAASAAASLGANLQVEAAIDVDRKALDVHRSNHGSRRLLTTSADHLVDFVASGRGASATFDYEPEIIEDSLLDLRGSVDLLIGGPPCQGHSSLNNRSRHEDDRNDLYLVMPALAIALDAPAVIIENVPGVLRDSANVVESTRTLLEDAGYTVEGDVLSAQVLGWPQTRKRYFLVATKGPDPINPKLQMHGLARPSLDLAWAIRDLPPAGESHPLWEGQPAYSQENHDRMSLLIEEDRRNLPNENRPVCHQEGTTYSSVYGRMAWDEPAPTLTTGFFTPGRGRFTHPDEPRTLTAREAARLQGFPEGYFSTETLHSVDATRALLSKWIGDAVPQPLGHVAALCALAPLLSAR